MRLNAFSQFELMEMHINALYNHNSGLKMTTINEPWDKSQPAPRFHLGKTISGAVLYRFRYDVLSSIIDRFSGYLLDEESHGCEIRNKNIYIDILESEKCQEEICYCCTNEIFPAGENCVMITPGNIKGFVLGDFEWLKEEIDYCQPCYGVTEGNSLISVCRSVRITDAAREAGIETIESRRGRGFALIALLNWAAEIQKSGLMPLYSTDKENKSSQRLAEKAGLYKFGAGISVY